MRNNGYKTNDPSSKKKGVIIGDSHTWRTGPLINQEMKSKEFDSTTWSMLGAKLSQITDVVCAADLTEKDCLILWGGSNDLRTIVLCKDTVGMKI